MSEIKKFIEGLGSNAPFLAFGAFMGALIYARHRRLKVWEAFAAIILGVGASVAIGPFLAHWLGFKDTPSTYAALGFLIGMLVKESATGFMMIKREVFTAIMNKNPQLKYNWTADKYEFVVPGSRLKLNTQSNNYEYVQTQIDPYQSQIGEE